MSLLLPNWRCFQSIASDAEASSFSEYSLFSLATLEVDCDFETKSFALTERERAGAWRWAIISAHGKILSDGHSATQEEAKAVATEALHYRAPIMLAVPA
jgi:hypothetical protein